MKAFNVLGPKVEDGIPVETGPLHSGRVIVGDGNSAWIPVGHRDQDVIEDDGRVRNAWVLQQRDKETRGLLEGKYLIVSLRAPDNKAFVRWRVNGGSRQGVVKTNGAAILLGPLTTQGVLEVAAVLNPDQYLVAHRGNGKIALLIWNGEQISVIFCEKEIFVFEE